MESLQQHKIKATLFPSLARLGGTDGLELVASWSAQGHWVGNHTASHKSLADPAFTLEEFIADVELADTAFKGLPTFTPMLRFPYLKEGDTAAKRDGFRLWMAALSDVIAAFTAEGWAITSTEAALQDPLYAQLPDTLPAGESIIWALAKAQNMPNLRYPAEDSVYEEPSLKDAGLLP